MQTRNKKRNASQIQFTGQPCEGVIEIPEGSVHPVMKMHPKVQARVAEMKNNIKAKAEQVKPANIQQTETNQIQTEETTMKTNNNATEAQVQAQTQAQAQDTTVSLEQETTLIEQEIAQLDKHIDELEKEAQGTKKVQAASSEDEGTDVATAFVAGAIVGGLSNLGMSTKDMLKGAALGGVTCVVTNHFLDNDYSLQAGVVAAVAAGLGYRYLASAAAKEEADVVAMELQPQIQFVEVPVMETNFA